MSKMTVACLQVEALGLARAEEALERALAMIDAAGQNRPDLMVLPECTYPAYYLESIEHYQSMPLRPLGEVVGLFAERALKYHSAIVVGIAEPKGERLSNSAYVFDAKGQVLGTYAKSFLWHFDRIWFEPGKEFPTFDLPSGRTGVFVCADGRMPEIARLMGVRGARLLIDSTAWVTGGGDRATLNNSQFEYMIPTRALENGVRQVQVNAKIGWTFAAAMRSFMRADPDVIMVGEMRDSETAKIGIEASLTGHLVLSTLHTNSAPESIVRLLDLGMDPFNFADALLGVLAERLARRLCPECKIEYLPTSAELEELVLQYCNETALDARKQMKAWIGSHGGAGGKIRLFRPQGCAQCDQIGYQGRIGLYELLVADPETKRLLQTKAHVSEVKSAAVAAGMRTLRQDGIEKVLQGVTDIQQVGAVCS